MRLVDDLIGREPPALPGAACTTVPYMNDRSITEWCHTDTDLGLGFGLKVRRRRSIRGSKPDLEAPDSFPWHALRTFLGDEFDGGPLLSLKQDGRKGLLETRQKFLI